MLTVAIGHSDDPDAYAAAKDVIEQCQTKLQGRSPQVGILFAALDFDHGLVLETLRASFPEMVVVGCTTDGELSSELAFQQDSVVLMAIASDTLSIGAGVGYGLSRDPDAAIQRAIAQARESLNLPPDAVPSLCLTFPESLTYDSPLVVAHLQKALGDSVPLFGGFAGDQSQFQKTYQFYGSEVLTDAIPLLLFFGDLKLGHGVAHGWMPVGAKGNITRTDGHLLQEIDHRPALEFYQRYMNDLLPSTEFPLAVWEEGVEGYYLRASIGFDPETGSIRSIPIWPKNAQVQIAKSSRDEILEGARASMQAALDSYPGQHVEAVLLFSCCVRHTLLGLRTQQEYKLVQEALPQMPATAGFYTYGEIAPVTPNTPSRAHHSTFVTLLLGTA
ncbi:FIST signal transduction protein [Leptolyngbya sp. O-77]|uniref:FIST signal transduction protein n=1 Tax=Leptolyngbya sp. O-77 TaxID=1080068 RepID=UPI00074D3837|nr:FIST N-terminal domain-containing protein [Leptolyngbya sp. O-77]BAU44832.1 FIST N domain protein [Leptolyngbya sp. O-77]